MNLKKKKLKEGKQPRTLGHFLSVLLLCFVSFTVTFFYYLHPGFFFSQTNHTTLGLLMFLFLYVKEHLNLCDFQNKMSVWVLKGREEGALIWKGSILKRQNKRGQGLFLCVCWLLSPEKALYANLSPVPSLYSLTCPASPGLIVSSSLDSLLVYICLCNFLYSFCSMTVFFRQYYFLVFCWIFQHKFNFLFCFYLRIYNFIYVTHFIFPHFIYFIR